MQEEQVIPAAEQEETAASSIEATNATDSATGDSNEPQPEGEANKAKGGFQRRIDKLTREKADKEREAEYWRQQALRTPQPETKTETPKAVDKPKEDSFETHAEFVEALTDWKVEQKVKSFEAKQNEEKAKTHQQTQQQQLVEAQRAFAEVTTDFHEVMADATDIPVSPAMLAEIQSPEYGPQLSYFLAKNPDEAEKLFPLGPLALARAIGKLESRFTKAPSTPKANVSNAPPPPNPVGRSSPTSGKDPSDMSPSEYRAWRIKQNPNFDR